MTKWSHITLIELLIESVAGKKKKWISAEAVSLKKAAIVYAVSRKSIMYEVSFL